MAEFTSPKKTQSTASSDGFANMGKPVPMFRRQAAYDTCKLMGLEGPERITGVVGAMADRLERDQPYEAMEVGMQLLDLTGTYRLMSVLLTAPEPAVVPSDEDVYG